MEEVNTTVKQDEIWDAVTSFEQLRKSAFRAKRGVQVSKTLASFFVNLEAEILQIQEELRSPQQQYCPRPFVDFWIQDPKPRNIRAAHFRDRVVHHSICHSLEPIFERDVWLPNTFACRKNKGSHKAIQRVKQLVQEFPFFGKIDIRHCFENIYHPHLIQRLQQVVPSERLMKLISQQILPFGAEKNTHLIGKEPTLIEKTTEHRIQDIQQGNRGLPIGNLTSQHFANFVLHDIDILLEERSDAWVRYMDDVLFFSKCKSRLWEMFYDVQHVVEQVLFQNIKYEDVLLEATTVGVPFLGFRVYRKKKQKHPLVRLDKSRVRRFRKNVRKSHNMVQNQSITEELQQHHISSIQSRISWIEHADTKHFRYSFFEQL